MSWPQAAEYNMITNKQKFRVTRLPGFFGATSFAAAACSLQSDRNLSQKYPRKTVLGQ